MFYHLTIENDKIALSFFDNSNGKKEKPSKYSFVSCDDNDLLCKLFFNVINRFKSTSPQIKNKFDVYVKEIFRCLLGNDFYKESLMNLKLLSNDSFYQTVNTNFTNLNPLYISLSKIVKEMHLNNRMYLIYEKSFDNYISDITQIIKNLRQLMNVYFGEDLAEIDSKTFAILPDKNPEFKEKLINFQKTITFTNFLSKFDEFLIFYSKSRTFFPKDQNKLPQVAEDNMNFLLKFIYYSFVDNPENLVLLTNINSKNFLNTFKDFESFYVVLSVMADLFFPKKDLYRFNNNNFILEILNSLIEDIKIEIENKVSYAFI